MARKLVGLGSGGGDFAPDLSTAGGRLGGGRSSYSPTTSQKAGTKARNKAKEAKSHKENISSKAAKEKIRTQGEIARDQATDTRPPHIRRISKSGRVGRGAGEEFNY